MEDPAWLPAALAGGALTLAALWAVTSILRARRARRLPVRTAQAVVAGHRPGEDGSPAVVFTVEGGGEIVLTLPPGLPPPAVGQEGRVVYRGGRLLHFSRAWPGNPS